MSLDIPLITKIDRKTHALSHVRYYQIVKPHSFNTIELKRLIEDNSPSSQNMFNRSDRKRRINRNVDIDFPLEFHIKFVMRNSNKHANKTMKISHRHTKENTDISSKYGLCIAKSFFFQLHILVFFVTYGEHSIISENVRFAFL